MTDSVNEKKKGEGNTCLNIQDVVKRFPGITAVDHVSLEVMKGEIFTFLGPSGCGKTTLLRLVAGLEMLDHGDILIAEEVVNNLPPFKRNCSMVFQNHALFPHMTVYNNIGFGLVERRLPKSEIKKKVSDMIDLVTLTGMEGRHPDQLSGGQRQRVALARSLVLEPMILLLDEPLAALDRKLRKEMQVELKRIQREVGITFMNVTHDQKEALSLSDRIAVMKEGKIVQLGTPNEIYESPRTKFVAGFMGASNIFSGRAEACKDGRIEFRSGEGLRLTLSDANGINIDDIEGVSVNPDVIGIALDESEIKRLDSDGYTILRGQIKDIFYQGDFSELTVTVKDVQQDLSIQLARVISHGKELCAGLDIIVYWDRAHNNTLIS